MQQTDQDVNNWDQQQHRPDSVQVDDAGAGANSDEEQVLVLLFDHEVRHNGPARKTFFVRKEVEVHQAPLHAADEVECRQRNV